MLIRVLAIMLCLCGVSRAAVVTDFSDIQYWVGSGTNEASLVLQWNDGKSPVSLAWGFRWDGAATGWDMIAAIAAADTRLTIQSSIDPTYGHFIYGILFDSNGDGSGLDTSSLLTDSSDRYQNGSDGGFWGYDIGQGSTLPGTSGTPDWTFSDFGVDFTSLTNQSWNAFNYTLDYLNPPVLEIPVAVVAVPEPQTISLMAFFGLALWWRFRSSWRFRSQLG